MSKFETVHIPSTPAAVAPDGSDVRLLLGLSGGGMAHFELGPNKISKAVAHRTVEEIWALFVRSRADVAKAKWRNGNRRRLSRGVHHHSIGDALSIPVVWIRAALRGGSDDATLARRLRTDHGGGFVALSIVGGNPMNTVLRFTGEYQAHYDSSGLTLRPTPIPTRRE
jgi:hypothetical protein